MKRYSEYKDSGVKWIGEIPGHWKVNKIRSLLKLSSEKTDEPNATLLSLSQYTGVKLKSECERTGMFEAENTIGYNVVHKGQFVMNIMLAWNGSYSVSKYDGVISPAYCVFDFIADCNKDYYDFLLRLKSYSGAFKTLSKGLIDSRLRLYPNYFKTFPVLIPPLNEQNEIVTYLDYKVAKIDEYISIAEKKIAALEELKQTIIAEAVTRGIRKDVPMKDSGVKWIGMIPEHWECRKLKFLTSSMQSGDNLTAIQIKETGKYPVYGGNGIRGYYDESNCNKQCIVIGRQGALCGNVHIVKEPFWATDHAVVTYANENTDLDFLFYLAKAMNLNQYASQTAAQPGIAVSAIKNIYTCYPPLPEQQEIVTYIEAKAAKIDQLCQAERAQIEKLKEYKQRLISDVVTGKVKVMND